MGGQDSIRLTLICSGGWSEVRSSGHGHAIPARRIRGNDIGMDTVRAEQRNRERDRWEDGDASSTPARREGVIMNVPW